MSLVSKGVANLFNGVSEQPAALRAASQGELQENLYSAIATGTRKRPPAKHRAKSHALAASTAYIHYINRDSTRRYEVRIRNGAIDVWDIESGVSQTVLTPDGVGYLSSFNPRNDFAVVTAADYTFIVNKTKLVQALPARSGRVGTSGTAGSVTSLTLSGETATFTTVNPHGQVVGDWVTIAGASQAPYNGPHQVLTVPNATSLTFKVTGSPASPATGTLTFTSVKGNPDGTKQKFSDLTAGTGSLGIYKIVGDPTNNFDDYYVQDVGPGNVYVETLAPGSLYQLDPDTMPFQLVPSGPGAFTFSRVAWEPRKVGDDVSNPFPSFLGNTISNVFFHRNRLGFLSKESMILSRAGSYFDFFAETVTALLDSDPIDLSAAHTKVALLRSAVSFNGALMAFSDETQFQLTGGSDGLLTPSNAKLDPVTEFEADSEVRPVGAGQTMFFSLSRGGFSAVREYFVEKDTVTNDAADITAHVPSYISGSIYSLAASTSEDILVALTAEAPNVIYVYKYYWAEDNRKIQSSWSKFVFDVTDVIVGCTFVGSRLDVSVDRADGHYIDSIDFQANLVDDGLPFQVHLDRRVSVTGVYDSGNNWTTWTLPHPDSSTLQVVLGGAWGTSAGVTVSVTRPSDITVRASGNYAASPVFIGRPYTARYRFSRFFIRDQDGLSVIGATIKVLHVSVSFHRTGHFRAEVTPQGRGFTYKYTYTGRRVGASGPIVGLPQISDGEFRFPVMSDSAEVTIDLVADSALPCSFVSAEWEGDLTTRSRRV